MTDSSSLIGQTISHYRIIEKIGAGGMGEVYRARDVHLDREVAIKVLPKRTLIDEQARELLHKEAVTLSKLNHPHIATIYDFDTQQGLDFLVMEYVSGETLSRHLSASVLSEKEVAALGLQIAQALEEAHEHGIIHRDLKPANIAITSKGQAKVLDFGLAKLFDPTRGGLKAETLTQSVDDSHLIGTLPYMAPEQVNGERSDARADIWAAGCVLYEMATHQRPFREESTARLFDSILHQVVVAPRALNPRISPEMERIILKCLEKEPENRYQSAKELVVDLRRPLAPVTASSTTPAAGSRKWNWWKLAGMGIVVLALVALAIGFNMSGTRARFAGTKSTPIRSIAVLPLANLSHDPEQEYFADGMTEELINNLGKIAALRVISRTSVMQYKKTDKSLPQIARELNVDGVIEGAVLRADNRVRITAQLIQASTDRQLWGESYERDLRDVLALQSEVARAIASKIKSEVTPHEQARLVNDHPVNPEAYALYLQGEVLWGRDTDPDNRAAIEVLERAATVDPNFAPTYAALGRAYTERLFGWEPKDEWKDKAEAAVEKALSLDPDLAEAHVSRAALLFTPAHGWQYERAIQECKQALALDPNLAEGHLTLGEVLFHVGLLDEALQEFQSAAAINPALPNATLYEGFTLMFGGKFQDALLFLHNFQPEDAFSRTLQALDLWELGRKEEAWALVREWTKAHPQEKSVWFAGVRCLFLVDSGKGLEAERLVKEVLKQGEGMKRYGHFHHLSYFVAMIYAQLNKPEQAVAWLEETSATGFPCYPFFERDRALDPIRQDPRFVAFMLKLKPQWEYLKATYGSHAAPPSGAQRARPGV